MNLLKIADVLNAITVPMRVTITPGTLMLFRGNNTLHRVTPTIGTQTSILVVFAYNKQPGVALYATARMNFFGRPS